MLEELISEYANSAYKITPEKLKELLLANISSERKASLAAAETISISDQQTTPIEDFQADAVTIVTTDLDPVKRVDDALLKFGNSFTISEIHKPKITAEVLKELRTNPAADLQELIMQVYLATLKKPTDTAPPASKQPANPWKNWLKGLVAIPVSAAIGSGTALYLGRTPDAASKLTPAPITKTVPATSSAALLGSSPALPEASSFVTPAPAASTTPTPRPKIEIPTISIYDLQAPPKSPPPQQKTVTPEVRATEKPIALAPSVGPAIKSLDPNKPPKVVVTLGPLDAKRQATVNAQGGPAAFAANTARIVQYSLDTLIEQERRGLVPLPGQLTKTLKFVWLEVDTVSANFVPIKFTTGGWLDPGSGIVYTALPDATGSRDNVPWMNSLIFKAQPGVYAFDSGADYLASAGGYDPERVLSGKSREMREKTRRGSYYGDKSYKLKSAKIGLGRPAKIRILDN